MIKRSMATPHVETKKQCRLATDAIHVLDPRNDGRWERLTRSTAGSIFTSPPWIRAVCDTYGFNRKSVV